MRRCGLGFLSPRPTADAYAASTSDVYRPLVSAYHGRRIDAETVQDEQRVYAEALRGFVAAHHRPTDPASVLDVGGSTGIVAAAFAGDAVRLTVLDPAPDELAVAEAAGMEVIEGFAEDLRSGRASAGTSCCCARRSTTCSTYDATLRAIRGCWRPAGTRSSMCSTSPGCSPARASIEDSYKIDHPYYLTRTTALGFFARTGLEVVGERMSDDGHWGFVLAPAERA